MEGRLQLYLQFIAACMNHHTVTVSKLKCRSNKEGIGGNRRQFQTGQIVVSLQIIPKPVFLVINVLFHLVTLQYDCFFAYNPIIPADYKSRRRHFLTKCLLLRPFFVLIVHKGSQKCRNGPGISANRLHAGPNYGILSHQAVQAPEISS